MIIEISISGWEFLWIFLAIACGSFFSGIIQGLIQSMQEMAKKRR